MRSITPDLEVEAAARIRGVALTVLGVYVAFAACVNAWRIFGGDGSIMFLVAQACLVVAISVSMRSGREHDRLGDWLPLISLPILYWGLPWSMPGTEGRMHDSMVQGWDRALFGTDVARTMAGAAPSWLLSEVLHLAYLAYFVIIYLPPLILYRSGHRRGYHATVLAFTLTMVASFVAFSVFPVEGPRFAWPAPAGIPTGPFRSLTVFILENGSTRGTAFPSSHVAIAVTQALSSWRWRPRLGVGVGITTLLLATGAVYGGFHYAVDILAGATLGLVAWVGASGVETHLAKRL